MVASCWALNDNASCWTFNDNASCWTFNDNASCWTFNDNAACWTFNGNALGWTFIDKEWSCTPTTQYSSLCSHLFRPKLDITLFQHSFCDWLITSLITYENLNEFPFLFITGIIWQHPNRISWHRCRGYCTVTEKGVSSADILLILCRLSSYISLVLP